MGKRIAKGPYLAGLAQSLRELADQVEQGQYLAVALVSCKYNGVVCSSCSIEPEYAAAEHLAAMGEEVNALLEPMAFRLSVNRQARLNEQVGRQSFVDLFDRAPE
jgi:hypothetical protein